MVPANMCKCISTRLVPKLILIFKLKMVKRMVPLKWAMSCALEFIHSHRHTQCTFPNDERHLWSIVRKSQRLPRRHIFFLVAVITALLSEICCPRNASFRCPNKCKSDGAMSRSNGAWDRTFKPNFVKHSVVFERLCSLGLSCSKRNVSLFSKLRWAFWDFRFVILSTWRSEVIFNPGSKKSRRRRTSPLCRHSEIDEPIP